MTQRIGIALLIAVCACSTTGPETDPPVTADPPADQAPASEALPPSARLVPEPVDSVEDVPGRYVQPFALPGQVGEITLAAPDYGVGTFTSFRSCGVPTCVPENGQYSIVPTNPAIGFAALSLVDATGTVRVTYVLDYLWRDADGALVAIQLRALIGNTTGPTQVWWRAPADAPDAPVSRTVEGPVPAEPTTIEASSSRPALPGVYIRALPIYGDIDALTINDAAWSENAADGTYSAAYPYCLPWCLGESGDYRLDLANVATGTGQLSLIPAGNIEATHDYGVYAIWRGLDGKPAAIQLQRFDGVVASGPPFTLYRQWWTGSTAAAAAPDNCSFLTSLAAYYRIRALQCGMSACWALSPWYSAWAQYYDGLAAAAALVLGLGPVLRRPRRRGGLRPNELTATSGGRWLHEEPLTARGGRRESASMSRLCLVLVALVACGNHHPTPGPGPDATPSRLLAITVSPADQELTIDGSTPALSAYTAVGQFEDGHSEDITAQVGFSLDDPSLGVFAGADFTSTLTHGGHTRVRADLAGVQGDTGLVLRLKQSYSDPSATGLPVDPAAPFGGPADVSRAPDVVYPNDGVLLPPNLRLLEVHFLPGANNTLFELSFENALTDVKVYTRCTVPMNGGCIYTPDATVWSWIAETNRGGDPVTVHARATDDTGTGVGTSSDISIAFSFQDIKGGIYYWKASGGTTGDSAVMRYDFGSTTQTTAERFVGPSMASGKCVGCHALSRDGTKLVAAAGGWDVEDDLLVDVASASRVATPAKAAFASWNPSGTTYVGVFADTGTPTHNLMLFDGATGARTGTIDVGATAAASTSHPDWSADGTRIAYVRQGQAYEQGVNNQRFYKGRIDMVTDQGGGAFGVPTTIVPAIAGKNRYYPAFSPDGALLAFNESTCPSGSTGVDCNADSDPTATVFVVKPDPTATPLLLARANAGGKTDAGATALRNSWPKWAPFEFQRTQTPGSRVMWLTFSSSRRYGLRTPPPGTSSEASTGALLWMVAIDPDLAAQGVDPSVAAFCLPFQDVTTSNHIAQWTEEVITLQ